MKIFNQTLFRETVLYFIRGWNVAKKLVHFSLQALVLNNASRVKSTAGEIVNLMSVDAQRLADALPYLNILWSGPFQIGVALYFLHLTMGWVIYAGLGVMILFTPLNILMTRSINKYQVLEDIFL